MTERTPLHTLVFDLDDTLYPERDFVFSGFRAVDHWLSENCGATRFYEFAEKLFSEGRRGKIFDDVLQLLGIEPQAPLIVELLTVYRTHAPRIELCADAREILDWAAARFGLALVTDGFGEVQARKIVALGLDRMIPCRVITDQLGREFWKPSPEPYRKVMEHFPGPANGFVYVGDNARKDFMGARSLGWRTVRIRRPLGEHANYRGTSKEAADLEIESLLELRQLTN